MEKDVVCGNGGGFPYTELQNCHSDFIFHVFTVTPRKLGSDFALVLVQTLG